MLTPSKTRNPLPSVMMVMGLLMAVTVPAMAKELPFAVVTASAQGMVAERQFDAVIEAVRKATVSAETAGRVVEMRYDVNDSVRQGEVLARFKGIEQRAELGGAQAALRDAQSRLAEAKANYDRMQALYEQKLVTKAAMDNATATRNSAQEQVEAVRARLQQAEAGVGYTEIRAPFNGVVIQRHIESGEAAQPGQPILTLVAQEALRATATVPQGLLNAVLRQPQVRLLVPGLPIRYITPRKITPFPIADALSHSVKLRMELPAGDHGLIPGLMVKAIFVVGSDQRMKLPESAIARRSELTGVYVLADKGRVVLRQVRVGKRTDSGQVEILSGLNEGERVAADAVKATIYAKQQRTGK